MLLGNIVFQFSWMSLMWTLCILRNNGSMVDFGWPSGFTLMAIYYLITGTGYSLRKYLTCGMYLIAGLRFMLGWTFKRNHWNQEDHRWEMWRTRWRNGQGLLGIRSIPVNFFFFYHCQSMSNALFMSIPLIVCSSNPLPYLTWMEVGGAMLWCFGFIFENTADHQLTQFKKQQAALRTECERKGSEMPPRQVMNKGLWKYSRHPNYFGEWLLWVAYSLISLPSVRTTYQLFATLCLPLLAYYFLVHFTGIWMAEQASLKRRGELYKEYQMSTSAFFPWIPTTAGDHPKAA